MSYSADAAAFQVQERLKALYKLVHEIEEECVRSEHNLLNITKTHDKINQEEKISLYYQQKLKTLYTTAITNTAREEEKIRLLLAKLNEIRAIRNNRRIHARKSGNKDTIGRGALMTMLKTSARTLPLYVGKVGEKAPPLCGAVPAGPNYIAKPGDVVAALVRGTEAVRGAEEGDNWILAEVANYNVATGKYEVDDIDQEPKNKRILLNRQCVVPLPLMRANPETDSHALFSLGSVVMAVYPTTTCFYKAIIHQLPTTATEEYKLLFDDPGYDTGYSPPVSVAQRYVISIKEKKGKTSQM